LSLGRGISNFLKEPIPLWRADFAEKNRNLRCEIPWLEAFSSDGVSETRVVGK
jgi:hypothetical protein